MRRAAEPAHAPTGSETPWWREVNVVSSYVIPPDLEDLVNVVGWGNYVELPEQQESVWLKTGKLHFRDGRYVGSISANDAMYETYLERPELADAAVIGIHGRPLTVTWECTPEQPRWWGNTNHPVWQAFLLEQGQALVDGGVDGIVIDEIGGTAGSVGSGGSFGEPDMSLFRAYLSDVYTPQELFDQFGIEDIETFDYGDHIRDHGLADEWLDEEQQTEVPLYDDFLRFQRLAAFDVMAELIRETKSYALTTYGREVTFTANLGGLWNHGIIYADLVDYITVEYPYSYFGYPPQSQAVAATKLARALEDKPAVLFHSLSTVADLVNQGPVTEMMKIHIAEAYATRGTLMTPHVLAAPGGGQYSADTTALKPFYRFVIENAFLYRDPESLAQVAVLYSVASDYFHGGYHDNLWGLHFALLDGQVQYDVVTAGDDVWMPDTLAAEDLEPYRLVLLGGGPFFGRAPQHRWWGLRDRLRPRRRFRAHSRAGWRLRHRHVHQSPDHGERAVRDDELGPEPLDGGDRRAAGLHERRRLAGHQPNDLLMRSLLTWVARWPPPYGHQVYLRLVLCEGNGWGEAR
jgi:hypothetical protein